MVKLKFITLLTMFVFFNAPFTTWAAPLAVVNQGFEDITGESPVNEFTFGELNGWELHDPNVITDNGDGPTFFIGTLTPFEPNPGVYAYFPAGAAEGQRVGIAFNFDGSEGLGEYGLFQELGDTLQPYTTYTLEVEIGNIDSGTAISGQFFPLEGFPGYRVELLAGGVMLAQDDNSLAGAIPDGQFATSTVTYTTGGSNALFGQNLGILLVNLNQEDPSFPDSDIEVDFDDVRLDASPALAGDFEFDGDADGLDFLVWQRGETNSPYDASDFTDWKSNFGTATPLPIAAATIIPEPSSLLLGILASLLSLTTLRRRTSLAFSSGGTAWDSLGLQSQAGHSISSESRGATVCAGR